MFEMAAAAVPKQQPLELAAAQASPVIQLFCQHLGHHAQGQGALRYAQGAEREDAALAGEILPNGPSALSPHPPECRC